MLCATPFRIHNAAYWYPSDRTEKHGCHRISPESRVSMSCLIVFASYECSRCSELVGLPEKSGYPHLHSAVRFGKRSCRYPVCREASSICYLGCGLLSASGARGMMVEVAPKRW